MIYLILHNRPAPLHIVPQLLDIQLGVEEISVNIVGRVRRSPDGFDIVTMPKSNLVLGEFPDQKPNVKGVNKEKGGLVGVSFQLIFTLLLQPAIFIIPIRLTVNFV